jgi:signal transduction histidine kinase
MTSIATSTHEDNRTARSQGTVGLSGRLALVTIAIVLLAQIVVFVPSLTMFRRSWLNDRVVGARMVALVLAAYPDGTPLPKPVETSLMAGIPPMVLALRGNGTRWLQMRAGPIEELPITADLRVPSWSGPLRGLLRSLLLAPDRPTRVLGAGVQGVPAVSHVDVILDEAQLRDAMLAFSRSFLIVSLLVSGIAAALMFFVLHRFFVRPVHRLTTNIRAFSEAPDDAARIIVPSARTDEIGVAERALARMETSLAGELRQKRHLAQLGLMVSKINHELRNMLTTAQLLGDRLGELEDPAVKRVAPRLIRTLRRAIEYCSATMAYGRIEERAPDYQSVALAPLVLELADLVQLAPNRTISLEADCPAGFRIQADPDQLSQILGNLVRNAVQALAASETPAPRIQITAYRKRGSVMIRVADNGPGVPARMRTRIFEAFETEHAGGTGLGLLIADELVRLHGGTITLEESQVGASFLVQLPDREKAPAPVDRRQPAAHV